MQAKQPDSSLINVYNLNSHLNPENTIIANGFIEKIFKTTLQSQSSSNMNKI